MSLTAMTRCPGEKVGWKNDVQGREAAYAARHWCQLPDMIMEAAERLRGVQIENRPAIEVISRFNYPNVLIYADPPYLLSTRHSRQYRCEMSEADHIDLLTALIAHRGPVVLSGYKSPLYEEVLSNWHTETINVRNQLAAPRTEVIWTNFIPK